MTWRGFAEAIFLGAGLKTRAEPIRTEDWPTPAARPRNSRLNCAAIGRDYGIAQPDWRDSLADVLGELKDKDL